MKGTTGGSEMVQVEGGHILRSTCRKDRHSKVYTSKGPRDRRVRLSAHTAIQFYDVQDRLGYDRPSKAVDWLLNKAKTAIDNLHHSEDHSLIQPNGFTSSPADQPDANLIKPFFPTPNFAGFSDDDSASFQAEDLLGLSLHSFQGNSTNFPGSCFQRIPDGGWNNGGDMDARVGFLTSLPENSAVFSHRELLQSNSPLNPWNQRQFGSTNQQNPHQDFDSPFELGFRVPARIYGDEDGDDE